MNQQVKEDQRTEAVAAERDLAGERRIALPERVVQSVQFQSHRRDDRLPTSQERKHIRNPFGDERTRSLSYMDSTVFIELFSLSEVITVNSNLNGIKLGTPFTTN